jgi:hypothetical protein
MTQYHITPDWSLPIEAIHSGGRCCTLKVAQLNAGVNPGNDHWLRTADGRRLDSSPGALGCFWASSNGAVPAYPGWRVRNVEVLA